jgi:hypothetical protein
MSARLAACAVMVSVLGLTAGSAIGAPLTLRQLLAEGFEVKSTSVIPADVVKRAMNNDAWIDDVMLTLQRGQQIAFCHLGLVATANVEANVDTALCSNTLDPAFEAPAPAAPAPAASSELPMSSAASSLAQ